jgi:LuxR family quorum-sensing system transcriptional regulator CciR
MGEFSEILPFIAQLNTARDLERLGRAVDGVAKQLGFEYFSLGHHAKVFSDGVLHISNYPSVWAERLATRPYLSDDPAVAACQKAIVGFLWSDIHRLITLTDHQKTFLSDARGAGLGEGFTVPIHIPGECAGSCNFVTVPGRSIPPRILPAAQYVGGIAFEAARRLVRNSQENRSFDSKQTMPRLSSRQFDCLVLAAQGKSDTDVGQLLGISSQTVHQHIEAAKHRYGVATRAQLIVHALFDGQLAYEDIIHH